MSFKTKIQSQRIIMGNIIMGTQAQASSTLKRKAVFPAQSSECEFKRFCKSERLELGSSCFACHRALQPSILDVTLVNQKSQKHLDLETMLVAAKKVANYPLCKLLVEATKKQAESDAALEADDFESAERLSAEVCCLSTLVLVSLQVSPSLHDCFLYLILRLWRSRANFPCSQHL